MQEAKAIIVGNTSVRCFLKMYMFFGGCPVIKASKAKNNCAPETDMQCVECSAIKKKYVLFCNNTRNGIAQICHWGYHGKY